VHADWHADGMLIGSLAGVLRSNHLAILHADGMLIGSLIRFAGVLRSDHLAILHAYEAFRRASARGAAAARELCRTNFLSWETLTQMDQVMSL